MKNICHIIGYQQDLEEVIIDDTFSIRKLSDAEEEILRKLYEQNDKYSQYLIDWLFCIDFKYELTLPDPQEEFPPKFPNDLKKIIVVIWLFSGRAVTPLTLLFYDEHKKLPEFIISNNNICEGSHWLLADWLFDNFIEFWRIFKDISIDLKEISLQYLNEAMVADTLKDKLIKLTIAMERILLPGDDRHELTYKYSTRAALLLTKDFKKRKKIKKLFNKFYRIRSIIVHGSKLKENDNKYIENNYSNYFHYCRKIICLSIENHGFENQDKWKKLLEDASLGENRLKYNLADLMLKE